MVAGKGRMKRSRLKTYSPLQRTRWERKSYDWRSSSTLKRSRSSRLRAKRDPKLAAWSKKVRERDGNQCQWPGGCQTGDVRIDPHHLAKKSQRRDLKYVVENGRCLCRTHHDWTDNNHDAAVAMGLLNTESRELARKVA